MTLLRLFKESVKNILIIFFGGGLSFPMAKPKPPVELEQFSIRFPRPLAAKLKDLAAASNHGMGVPFSAYINAVAEEAAARGITINEVRRVELSDSLAGGAARKAAEDPGEYRGGKKDQDKLSA